MTTVRRIAPAPRWVPPPAAAAAHAAALVSALPGLSPSLARVLAARGIVDPEAARAFLRPTLDRLHDPLGLPDMAPAVERLLGAIDAGETVFVHGDFDVDGLSATALAVRGLRRLGGHVIPFVPHRVNDGYDLRAAGVERAAARGAGLILTVDCGTTALAAVEKAGRRGLDVIVTDHHRPGPTLPDAVAVVNPMRADASYPFLGLAGVGVAFKLIAALYARRGVPDPELYQHLDLVALGTVADQVPLTCENRVLVRAGLRALARTRKAGLRALLRRAEIDVGRPIAAEHVAFRLGPRLNAVGRMAAAAAGLELLLSDDPDRAEALAAHLEEQNAIRRRTDRDVTLDVERALADRFDAEADRAVVVWGDDWHRGVVGIVASRMVERWRRPAIVVSFDGDLGEGSGRSVDGFHLYEALRECEGLLERFGGHRMAAGLSIRRDRIEAFSARLRELAAAVPDTTDAAPALCVDLELPLAEVTPRLADVLEHLGPHGNDNPAPVLVARGVTFERAVAVGREGTHLQATMRDGGAALRAIGFGQAERLTELGDGARLDVAFHLERDAWQGRERLQARLLDVREAGA